MEEYDQTGIDTDAPNDHTCNTDSDGSKPDPIGSPIKYWVDWHNCNGITAGYQLQIAKPSIP